MSKRKRSKSTPPKSKSTLRDNLKLIIGILGLIIMFIMLIIAFIPICKEPNQLTEQNKIAEYSIRRTNMPLGYVKFPKERGIEVDYPLIMMSDTLYIMHVDTFFNKGNGILYYVGAFFINSNKELDGFSEFSEKIFEKLIITIDFDGLKKGARFFMMIPGDRHRTICRWKYIEQDPDKEIFFYSIHLYKDQTFNLYGTIVMHKREPLKDLIHKYIYAQFFKEYSPEEQNELADFIEKNGHPSLAYYIRFKNLTRE